MENVDSILSRLSNAHDLTGNYLPPERTASSNLNICTGRKNVLVKPLLIYFFQKDGGLQLELCSITKQQTALLSGLKLLEQCQLCLVLCRSPQVLYPILEFVTENNVTTMVPPLPFPCADLILHIKRDGSCRPLLFCFCLIMRKNNRKFTSLFLLRTNFYMPSVQLHRIKCD